MAANVDQLKGARKIYPGCTCDEHKSDEEELHSNVTGGTILRMQCTCKNNASCREQWLPRALKLLPKNNIDPISFAREFENTLITGWSKGSHLFIIRQATWVKSFMPMLMSIMFDCFFCLSNSKFNFVKAINKGSIFCYNLQYGS